MRQKENQNKHHITTEHNWYIPCTRDWPYSYADCSGHKNHQTSESGLNLVSAPFRSHILWNTSVFME
jgi:hypothetical protein